VEAMIDWYLERLCNLARVTTPIRRFFLFNSDDKLWEWEQELASSPVADEFYARVLEQFRYWKSTMTPEAWEEVLTYNDNLNGANQNGLLDEV
jgi:hypothetical protein